MNLWSIILKSHALVFGHKILVNLFFLTIKVMWTSPMIIKIPIWHIWGLKSSFYLGIELSRFNSNIYICNDLYEIHQQSWTISCFYIEQAARMCNELSSSSFKLFTGYCFTKFEHINLWESRAILGRTMCFTFAQDHHHRHGYVLKYPNQPAFNLLTNNEWITIGI